MLKTLQQFILDAKEIHGEKYDYSLVEYKTTHIKVKLICPIHGPFLVRPSKHLHYKQGCFECIRHIPHRIISEKEVLEKFQKIHGPDKYNYSLFIYKSSKTKIIVICKTHGEFLITPNNHGNGQGCPRCSARISFISDLWLSKCNIPNDSSHREVRIKDSISKIFVDGMIDNQIFEFYGDYWHGNPKIFLADSICKSTKTTFGTLYQKTIDKENQLKDLGYQLTTIWESDFCKSITKEELANLSNSQRGQINSVLKRYKKFFNRTSDDMPFLPVGKAFRPPEDL